MDIKRNKERALISLLLLLMFSAVILGLAQQEGRGDIVSYLRQNPIFILVFLTPLTLWFYFLWKGNTKEDLKKFVRNDLIKYISKFISLIIATFLTYFILISHRNEDIWDVLIELVLSVTAFALFLFACWFEESKSPPLNRESLRRFGKVTIKPFLVIIISLGLMIPIFYFIFSISLPTSFIISFLYLMFFLSALSSFPKKKGWNIFSRIFIIGLLIFELYWMTKINLLSYNIFVPLSVFGGLVILIFSIISISCGNKSWFKKITKDLFYEIDNVPKTNINSPHNA